MSNASYNMIPPFIEKELTLLRASKDLGSRDSQGVPSVSWGHDRSGPSSLEADHPPRGPQGRQSPCDTDHFSSRRLGTLRLTRGVPESAQLDL